MFVKAYTPEQAASGKLENGREVIILYVKEFEEQYQEVKRIGLSHYTYNWFHNPENNAYVLQVSWDEQVHLAIRFDQQHFSLLAALVDPKDVILTSLPITQLVSQGQESGTDLLDFSGPVVTFSQMVFYPPQPTMNLEENGISSITNPQQVENKKTN